MNFDEDVKRTLAESVLLAESLNNEYLQVEHITRCLMEDEAVKDVAEKLDVNVDAIVSDLDAFIHSLERQNVYANRWGHEGPKKTNSVDRVVKRAMTKSQFNSEDSAFGTVDLLVSILSEKRDCQAKYFCDKHGLTKDRILKLNQDKEAQQEQQEMLEEFTVDLNREAQEGRIDTLIGREEELNDLVHILARRKKNNCILVGEAGTGKTAIAEGLAYKIVQGHVPKALADKRIYSLDLAGLLAGTRYRGDFEERIKYLLNAITKDPNNVLFIDEIHMIMGAGASNNSTTDVANLIKPLLGRGKLLTIGATTPDEYENTIAKDHALQRRFARLDIVETDVETTKAIVNGLRGYYETFHKVTYADDILDKAVDLTDRYIKTRFFPDKALDVVDAAGAAAKLRGDESVLLSDVIAATAKISKIGEDVIDVESTESYSNLAGRMKQIVFGQDQAVDKIVDHVILSKSGLREPRKPVGCFLFVGPTGTGKTETAKALAHNLQTELVRFDMSEYQERHSVSKLIGAPPGYVGHAEGKMGQGQLLAAVADNPNCVLLLDEVEKAAPEVLQVLLQVMDDGRLTGSAGKVVDFTNVTLLMTSNLGAADSEKRRIGFGDSENTSAMMDAVERFFTPEFRNRLDATVQFNKLTPELMVKIVERLVNETNILLTTNQRTVDIQLTDAAIQRLAEIGYEPTMGARPLKRQFEEQIKKPISRKILFQDLENSTVVVDFQDDEFGLEIQPRASTKGAGLDTGSESDLTASDT